MRIGLAQLNLTVGDLSANRRSILKAYADLVADGADIVVFPAFAVCGYHPRDLLLRSQFLSDTQASLEEIAAATGKVPALIGSLATEVVGGERICFGTSALCQNGRVEKQIPGAPIHASGQCGLRLDVAESAAPLSIFELDGRRIGILAHDGAIEPAISAASSAGRPKPDLVVLSSARPWRIGQSPLTKGKAAKLAKATGAPIACCNLVGGNDEQIFDGHSFVLDANGDLIGRLAAFEAATGLIDTAQATPGKNTSDKDASSDTESIRRALVLGIRDYVRKTGFQRALIALSGGLDSAVVAALAVEALGADALIGVSLPSSISSQHSRDDARALAQNLGIRFETIPIADSVAAVESTLAPVFAKHPRDVTEENLQARLRGVLMMSLSNKFGALLLTTGNKSESAVGYCTLYGDMCGGLGVINDLYKTQVYALARHLNSEREIIPFNTIEKAPSAELSPGQKDEDSLPPYPVLDKILAAYVDQNQSRDEIARLGFARPLVEEVCLKVDRNEYKRRQAAPGFTLTPSTLGLTRTFPLTAHYRG